MKIYPCRPSLRAFTLIELLTVVAIIGILAAILIPVLSSVRVSASAASLSSNYRQIGVAMNLFAADNQGHLPGIRNNNTSYALLGGQMPYRIMAYERTALQGSDVLGPYVASNTVTVGSISYAYSPLLNCPVMQSRYTQQQAVTLKDNLLSTTVSVDGTSGNVIYPFGLNATTIQNALTLNKVTNAIPLSSRWLMHDYDPNNNSAPIHGTNYVTLFYDGHVTLTPQAHMGANGLIN